MKIRSESTIQNDTDLLKRERDKAEKLTSAKNFLVLVKVFLLMNWLLITNPTSDTMATMTTNPHVLTIRVPDDIQAALLKLHVDVGITPAETTRRALRAHLKELGVLKPSTKATTKGKKVKHR